jgi:hypothetical protein
MLRFVRKVAIRQMGKKRDKHMEKLDKLIELLRRHICDEFTGHIKINFSQGGIGRIEKFEEILKNEK